MLSVLVTVPIAVTKNPIKQFKEEKVRSAHSMKVKSIVVGKHLVPGA